MTKRRRNLLGRCSRCDGKLSFHTRGDAERFLRDTQAPLHNAAQLTPYRCPFGNGFHTGHSRDAQPFVDHSKEA